MFYTPYPQDGLPTGQRKHAPITIVKEIDSSTPSLFQALVTGEKFDDVTLKYYQITEIGTEDQYYTQTLKNASIVSIRSQSPLAFLKKYEAFGHMEIVSFSYENIEWSHNTSNIHTDDKKCNSTSPLDDILKGLEFAFKTVFEIKKHAIKTVAHDVQTSLLNYIPFSPGLGFFFGRAVSAKEIADNYNCSEETIVALSQRLEEIRKKQ